MDDINLHFTGDFHAIGAAHNLLSAMVDNHIYHQLEPKLDPRRVPGTPASQQRQQKKQRQKQALLLPSAEEYSSFAQSLQSQSLREPAVTMSLRALSLRNDDSALISDYYMRMGRLFQLQQRQSESLHTFQIAQWHYAQSHGQIKSSVKYSDTRGYQYNPQSYVLERRGPAAAQNCLRGHKVVWVGDRCELNHTNSFSHPSDSSHLI